MICTTQMQNYNQIYLIFRGYGNSMVIPEYCKWVISINIMYRNIICKETKLMLFYPRNLVLTVKVQRTIYLRGKKYKMAATTSWTWQMESVDQIYAWIMDICAKVRLKYFDPINLIVNLLIHKTVIWEFKIQKGRHYNSRSKITTNAIYPYDRKLKSYTHD